MNRLFTAFATGLTVAALAAGCGGGGDNGGGDSQAAASVEASAPLTKAEFIKQAQALCEKNREQVAKNLTSYQEQNGLLNARDIGPEAVEPILLSVFRDEVDELSSLPAPRGDEEQIEVLLSMKQQAIEAVEKQSLSSNLELAKAFKPSDQLATTYGLNACVFS